MIGYLNGEILKIRGNRLIINCNGVGYLVSVSNPLLYKTGEKTEIFTYTYVKEDALSLFGFRSELELDLFELLLSVSGVGPKLGLSVFNAGSASEIIKAIREANVEFFTAVSGIGKKGAQRIIVELKSKLGEEREINLSDSPEQEDAIKGLMGLGFLKSEAIVALKKVDSKLSAKEQIRLALKNE